MAGIVELFRVFLLNFLLLEAPNGFRSGFRGPRDPLLMAVNMDFGAPEGSWGGLPGLKIAHFCRSFFSTGQAKTPHKSKYEGK